MTLHLSRRQTLVGLAIGAVALPTIGAAVAVPRYLSHAATARLSEQLVDLLADQHAAAQIGAAWRERHPAFFATTEILPDRLAARLRRYGWRDGQVQHESAQLGDLVDIVVRDDFLRGRVEDIAGWRLSTFQAELCGLAYLIRSRPSSA